MYLNYTARLEDTTEKVAIIGGLSPTGVWEEKVKNECWVGKVESIFSIDWFFEMIAIVRLKER